MKKYQIIGKLQKNAPAILTWAGIIGVGISLGLTCRSTIKAVSIIDSTKDTLDSIKSAKDTEYSETEKKILAKSAYTRAGLSLARVYAPPLTLCVASLTGIVVAHNISNSRNLALSAAYMAVDKGFTNYKQRVEDRFGKDVEREIRYNITNKDIVETETVDGKEKKKKKSIPVVSSELTTPHTCFFDDSSDCWDPDYDYNVLFLQSQQKFANDKLRVSKTGRLFLNEVYYALGLPETKDGQVLGWRYDAKKIDMDTRIDFNIQNCNRRTENGYERAFLLEFNVDGNVWDDMD